VKQFLNRFLDGLTYRDLAGRRRLRAFGLSVDPVFVELVGHVLFQRGLMMGAVQVRHFRLKCLQKFTLGRFGREPQGVTPDRSQPLVFGGRVHQSDKTIQPPCV
jgi:hypothetical protein